MARPAPEDVDGLEALRELSRRFVYAGEHVEDLRRARHGLMVELLGRGVRKAHVAEAMGVSRWRLEQLLQADT